ncbi:MAG: HD domain-containing protein [Methanomassiliicoccales archaeon]|jgi:hypothetical protein
MKNQEQKDPQESKEPQEHKNKCVPPNWYAFHHRDCGTVYRGCHPTKCPKDHYERTGEWKPELAKVSERNQLSYLKKTAKKMGDDVLEVCNPLFDDPRFSQCSGSGHPWQHHYGTKGLLIHTAEVVHLCWSIHDYFYLQCPIEHDPNYQLDPIELFLAALFHDSGKMYDYESFCEFPEQNIKYAKWEGTPHKRLIHHVSRSSLIWSEYARRNQNIYAKYHDSVLHAILAHHGQREFGSPVSPKTRVAWLVHFCDGISARLNDADTLDVVDRKIKD